MKMVFTEIGKENRATHAAASIRIVSRQASRQKSRNEPGLGAGQSWSRTQASPNKKPPRAMSGSGDRLSYGNVLKDQGHVEFSSERQKKPNNAK